MDNLCFFFTETSNLSGLKAVKPTTFAKPNPNCNPNPKLNPNPDQLAHFSSEMNNMIGLKAVKTVILRVMQYTKTKRCSVSLSFTSWPHFSPIFLGNKVQTSKKKIRTNVSSRKQACVQKFCNFWVLFLAKLSMMPFSTRPFKICKIFHYKCYLSFKDVKQCFI